MLLKSIARPGLIISAWAKIPISYDAKSMTKAGRRIITTKDAQANYEKLLQDNWTTCFRYRPATGNLCNI